MKQLPPRLLAVVIAAALAGTAHAEAPKTRAQVQAEYAEAVRTGDVMAPGDTGLKLNELYPGRYPHAVATSTLTRAQVQAELAEARRTGDVVAIGDSSGLKLNELYPERFPAPPILAAAKTRAEVKAELAEAIRNGDTVPAGEGALRLNEEFPQRYAKARARGGADAGAQHAAAMRPAAIP